jgi:TldD protein
VTGKLDTLGGLGGLDGLDGLGASLGRRADALGVYLVWRSQTRALRRVLVREGRIEETSSSSTSGIGLQVFTEDGGTALASRDDLRPEAAEALVDLAARAAKGGAALDLHRAPLPCLTPLQAREVPEACARFGEPSLAEVGARILEIEAAWGGRSPGPSLRVGFGSDLDAWRVGRSDGTDVLFAMPRCVLRGAATSAGAGARHTVGTAVFGPDPRLLWDEAAVALFLRRAEAAARLASLLPDAPAHPSGSFPLVIDYALAKGLAHEAFGHASEADAFRSSILARDGRFRAGETVGPEHVSIVDDTLRGDHAWQPYSPNGLRRERTTIVEAGRLAEALTDPWSAAEAGARVTGAERAESYRNAPVPRMSNIRIEVAGALPASGSFEDYGPEEVRDLLADAGVFRRHPTVVFLSGYSGGQVNTATGDFVFNCKVLYDLSESGVRHFRPAIFSGSMFGALRSIREAFGPLLLDALGTCGKWGQSVPSSGGSHWFLVLEPHPSVRIGGAS